MTKEEKGLLLKDLCARLPYGVKVQPSGSASPHQFMGYDKGLVRIDTDQRFELKNIKPYLRPMSSMTEEEVKELSYKILLQPDLSVVKNYKTLDIEFKYLDKFIEWLNKHHFDYRGLIEKGLAMEAPKGMYTF